MDLTNKITYICDIDQDIDDIVAIDFLHGAGVLKDVILDPIPVTDQGQERLSLLVKLGIKVNENIISGSEYVFVGGAFTKVAIYLRFNKIKTLVANGGFVGMPILKFDQQLVKFQGLHDIRTYNFNLDVKSTLKVLNSPNVQKTYLIGKNVCHSGLNTTHPDIGIWSDTRFPKNASYKLLPTKRLHDLLMCYEGLNLLLGKETLLSYYPSIYVVHVSDVNTKMTRWGVYAECAVKPLFQQQPHGILMEERKLRTKNTMSKVFIFIASILPKVFFWIAAISITAMELFLWYKYKIPYMVGLVLGTIIGSLTFGGHSFYRIWTAYYKTKIICSGYLLLGFLMMVLIVVFDLWIGLYLLHNPLVKPNTLFHQLIYIFSLFSGFGSFILLSAHSVSHIYNFLLKARKNGTKN